jgi:TonB family protein
LKSDASSHEQKPNEKEQIPVAAPPSPASLHPEANTKAGQGNVVPGEVKHPVVPDVPQKALDTIRGTLRLSVRVSVDQSGNVAEASFDAPGPSKYFADIAMRAARQWKFEPAKMNGQPLASEWILRFEFVNAGAKVFPMRATP